ncbi:MAG: hypothetical protein H7A20_09285 [Rhodanobacteraceae bacterium]|nr:hypothetical protein [Rhodanobacteraceae bacterium]
MLTSAAVEEALEDWSWSSRKPMRFGELVVAFGEGARRFTTPIGKAGLPGAKALEELALPG